MLRGLSRVLRAPVSIAMVLAALVGYCAGALAMYRVPGSWCVLAVAAGIVLLGVSLLVVAQRIALARPPAALQPVAAQAEPLILLLVVNLLILSLLLPVIHGLAAVPLPDSPFRTAIRVMAAVSRRGLTLAFIVGAIVLGWVILLRLLQNSIGRVPVFRWAGRAFDRLAVAILFLYCLAAAAFSFNGSLDTSPPVARPAEIVALEKVELPLHLGQFAWADLRDREPPHRTERLVLVWNRDEIWPQHAVPGQPVQVVTRAGRFGIPWVAAIRIDQGQEVERVLAAVPSAARLRKMLIAELQQARRWRDIRAHLEAHLRQYPQDREYALKIAARLESAGQAAEAAAITRLVQR